jgi:hypothetical protein
MKRYRNKQWGFELSFPRGWYRPGFFHKLIFPGQAEFFGPHDDSLKFAIAPISAEPDYRRHMESLRRIAKEHGHKVHEVGSIEVGGKHHATMTFTAAFDPEHRRRLKNYHLVFDGLEFVITASLESGEETIDSIVKTFRKLPKAAPSRP